MRLIINTFVIVLAIVFIRKTTIKEATIAYFLNVSIDIVVEVVSMLGSLWVDDFIYSNLQQYSLNGVFYIINDILCLIAYYIVIKIKNRHNFTSENNVIGVAIILVLNQFMWVYWASHYIVFREFPNIYLTIFVIIFQIINFYIVYRMIRGYIKMNKEKLQLEIRRDNQIRLKELINILSDKQHVVNNIYNQIQNENIEMIELDKMVNELKDIRNTLYSNNPSVNALLSYFTDECKKVSINSEINIYCNMKGIIDDFELNTLLINILKNAYESSNTYIKLDINNKNDTLVIKCENDCRDNKRTKKLINGNGTEIINNTVSKYQGYYKLDIANNIATTICILNIIK